MATRKGIDTTRWLAGWDEVPGSERVGLDPIDGVGDIHMCIIVLTSLRYLVRISGVQGNYRVVCSKVHTTPYRVKDSTAMSYTGPSLSTILATAAYEADLMESDFSMPLYSPVERVRWVAS